MDPNPATADADIAVLGYETWYPTILALRGAMRAAFPSSPRPTPTSSKEEILGFNTYWRGVFENLHKQVEADDSIPRFLATPPIKKFEINIFTENSGLDCPCCLPDVEPANIILENGDGLTKGDLILGVGKYLYGLDLDPSSSLVVTGNGGVNEKAGELLPVIDSEYEITIKPAYPPYLVREGDRERTLEEELDNENRPLGGWPMGGAISARADKRVTPKLEQEQEQEPEPETDVSDLYGNFSATMEIEKTEDPSRKQGPDSVSAKLAQLELGDKLAVDEDTDKETLDARSAGGEGKEPTGPDPDTATINADPENNNPDDGGDSKPSYVEIEDAPAVYRFPAVIYDYGWMSGCSEGPNGEKEIYAHWTQEGMPPVARIWLFVCPPEVFGERVEGAKAGQENQDRFYNVGEEKDADPDNEHKGTESN